MLSGRGVSRVRCYFTTALCVKNKFGLSYKDVADEDYEKVIEYIDFLKKNPN